MFWLVVLTPMTCLFLCVPVVLYTALSQTKRGRSGVGDISHSILARKKRGLDLDPLM